MSIKIEESNIEITFEHTGAGNKISTIMITPKNQEGKELLQSCWKKGDIKIEEDTFLILTENGVFQKKITNQEKEEIKIFFKGDRFLIKDLEYEWARNDNYDLIITKRHVCCRC